MEEGFPGGSVVKGPLTSARDTGSNLGQEDPLDKKTTTYSSVLTWEIAWTRNLVGYSPSGLKSPTLLSD